MKFIFNLLLFIHLSFQFSYGNEIILITYDHHPDRALLAYRILTQDLGLPKKLVHYRKQNDPCVIAQAIIQICIDSSGNMKKVIGEHEHLKAFAVFLPEDIVNE